MAKHNTYPVGYKRPPQHTKFKPGQSGNPAGRPKGSENKTPLLERLLFERVRLDLGGRKRTLSALEVIIYQIRRKVFLGDRAAIRNWLHLTDLCGVIEKKPPAETPHHHGVLVVPGNFSGEESPASAADVEYVPNAISERDKEGTD